MWHVCVSVSSSECRESTRKPDTYRIEWELRVLVYKGCYDPCR